MPDKGEVILFEHPFFRGAHRHIFEEENDLAATSPATAGPAGGQFDERTSSMVVKGHWTFFTEKNLTGIKVTVAPGNYPNVERLHIQNDRISSLRPATAAEVSALPASVIS